MTDSRLQDVAKLVVNYSLGIKSGEKVFIEALDITDAEILQPFINEIYQAGGQVFIEMNNYAINRLHQLHGSEAQFLRDAKYKLQRMKEMDAVLILLGEKNIAELSDIPAEKRRLYRQSYKPVLEERLRKKWVVWNYPTKAYAQLAGMSTQAFTNFLYQTTLIDYHQMSIAMDALVDLMNKTDRVRIVAPQTDLSFSIKGIGAIKCAGKMNLPDGEVFTAPVRNSVNGTITFNTKATYNGQTYSNLVLHFEQGKIIDASCDQQESLLEILNTDEGSRYIGEFAIGVNPYINHVMNDIAFDEKINGSVHFALGEAYEEADNENKSLIHWDIVLLLKPDFGGGEIYFDDRLISKDGKFVHEALVKLNPEFFTHDSTSRNA